jgi:hypothetical protein
MSTKSASRGGGSRGRQGGGKQQQKQSQQQSGGKDLMSIVKSELEQMDMQLPRDEGAREALIMGTRAYILAVAQDAVSGGRNFVFSPPLSTP